MGINLIDDNTKLEIELLLDSLMDNLEQAYDGAHALLKVLSPFSGSYDSAELYQDYCRISEVNLVAKECE